jgi:hypothetical protein
MGKELPILHNFYFSVSSVCSVEIRQNIEVENSPNGATQACDLSAVSAPVSPYSFRDNTLFFAFLSKITEKNDNTSGGTVIL